jgi:GxxExxY protein
MYWDDVKLDKSYRMDLVINGNIIVELKSVVFVETQHRRQLWDYMRLTHIPYGMLINFGNDKNLFSEWYYYDSDEDTIDRVRLL